MTFKVKSLSFFWVRSRMWFCACVGGVTALTLLGCSGGSNNNATGSDGNNVVIGGVGHIAYLRHSHTVPYPYHMFTIDPDGKNDTPINPESDLADYTGQSWSSDGKQIAFASNRSGNANFNIYVMNLDGTNLRPVVQYSGGDFAPSLSPDGTKILFQSNRSADTHWDIYEVNTDGTDEHALIHSPSNEELPAWSPDGTRFAFQSGTDSTGTDIYVANADGSNVRRLTDGNGRQHASPSWSPDGTKIAFDSNRQQVIVVNGSPPVAEYEIYVIDADGTNLQQITFGGNANSQARKPTWSPDGKQIAYEFDTVDPNTYQPFSTLIIMNTDGSNAYEVPNMTEGGIFPKWSPVP